MAAAGRDQLSSPCRRSSLCSTSAASRAVFRIREEALRQRHDARRYGLDMFGGVYYDVNVRLPAPPPRPARPMRARRSRGRASPRGRLGCVLPAGYAELEMPPSARTSAPGVRFDYAVQPSASTSRRASRALRDRAEVSEDHAQRGDAASSTRVRSSSTFSWPTGKPSFARSGQAKLARRRAADLRNLTASVEGFLYLLDDLVSAPRRERRVRYNNLGTGRFSAPKPCCATKPTSASSAGSPTRCRARNAPGSGEPSELFYLDQTHILTVLGSFVSAGLGVRRPLSLRDRKPLHALFRQPLQQHLDELPLHFGSTYSERLPPVSPARHPRRQELAVLGLDARRYLDSSTPTIA